MAARQLAAMTPAAPIRSGRGEATNRRIRRRHRAGGADEGRCHPEPRGREFRIGARHIGPDQAERQEVDDEDRPECRDIQHGGHSTRSVPRPLSGSRSSMTHPRFLAETMRGLRLTESHCDRRKRAFGFGFMNGAAIIGSLAMPPAAAHGGVTTRRKADLAGKDHPKTHLSCG